MKTNIAFFGSSKYSLFPLKALIKKGYRIAVIISQPPRPKGRGDKITPTPVAKFAQAHKIPQITPTSLKKNPLLLKAPKKFCQALRSYHPDLLILAAYGQIVPKEALTQTPHGGLNIHPSFLPKYRGAAPAQWAILRGENKTGVTIVKMTETIDTGSIVAQKSEPIRPTDTAPLLYQRLFKKGTRLLLKILPDYLAGKITLIPQGSSPTSYARKLTRQDGYLPADLIRLAIKGRGAARGRKSRTSSCRHDRGIARKPVVQVIERAIRALTPWPGVWTKVKLKVKSEKLKVTRLKILKAHLKKGKLILDQVQLEGKKPVSWEEFKRSYHESIPSI